tara:strand:+ start:1584 stop:2381 length:798 start_codon:yes stop_codon:yes gene_type:complete
MAETLTFENTDEVTTAENLSSDEQDSLQVGEAMQEAQDNLLAGKYKDAQELESAYIELQKKLGEKGSETSEEAGNTEATQEETKEEDTEETKKDSSEANVLDELWEESISNEKFSDEVLEKLQQSSPGDLAKAYLSYRQQTQPQQLTDQNITELKGIAGGEKGYNDMLQWAEKSLNKQEIDMFDQVMEKGDPLAAFFAVRSLAYRYEDSRGVEGRMLTGTAPKSDGSQFRSQAEVVQAMSDPRYERDSAYRSDIMKKLERSNVNF